MNRFRRTIPVLSGLILSVHALIAIADDQYLEADGISLRYVDHGDGAPVVLVHGFTGSVEVLWDEPGITAALIDAGYRVIAFDSRGHGKSAKLYDPNAYGIEMVRDIERLLDHLGIDRAHIVGYSMGARLANKFRELNADRILSVTLGGYGWGREFEVAGRGASTPLSGSEVDAWLRAWSVAVAEMNDSAALAAVLPQSVQWKAEEQLLRANTTPTLALIGNEDERLPYAESMTGFMPNLEIKIVSGTHLSAFENPDFAQALLDFLGSHSDL
jgi:pimeloyl-ACP methyl ester carboxylesterase